jgi:hydroxypyruvate isomerase
MPTIPTYTVNASILLTDLPILQRPRAVAAAGFTAAEFWWPFGVAVPTDSEVDAFVEAVRDAGIQLSGLNFFAGDMPAGDRGLVSWVGRESEFADNVDVVVGIGDRLGCRAFNALYGLRTEGVAPEASDELGAANLRLAADKIAQIGGTVLLEPVSGSPAYPLKTAADVQGVIDRVGAPNVKLLADFYHLAVNGDDVATVIAQHAAAFGHIQIADDPGRGQPGTGALPLTEWLASAAAGGYNGYVGLEYKDSSADPFGWLPRDQRA